MSRVPLLKQWRIRLNLAFLRSWQGQETAWKPRETTLRSQTEGPVIVRRGRTKVVGKISIPVIFPALLGTN